MPASILRVIAAYCAGGDTALFSVPADLFPKTCAKISNGAFDATVVAANKVGGALMQRNLFEPPSSSPSSSVSPIFNSATDFSSAFT
jgi:hypothetical protein